MPARVVEDDYQLAASFEMELIARGAWAAFPGSNTPRTIASKTSALHLRSVFYVICQVMQYSGIFMP